MNLTIIQDPTLEKDQLILHCHEITPYVTRLKQYAQSINAPIIGTMDTKQYLLFMTDFLFTHLKYGLRITFCILSAFIGIEAYTLYYGWQMTGRPTTYLLNNQMIFLEFICLLIGWLIYSKLSSLSYQRLLKAYQDKED